MYYVLLAMLPASIFQLTNITYTYLMQPNSNYSLVERLLLSLDSTLRATATAHQATPREHLRVNLSSNSEATPREHLRVNPSSNSEATPRKHPRANPAAGLPPVTLSAAARQSSIAMLRVNHAGEVCAQALYKGQALFARDQVNRDKLLQAAQEEIEHLEWCKQRLQELGASTSKLEPLWFTGSLVIGALASLVGDRFSLGFLAETEYQVAEHLAGHLAKLPVEDLASRVILQQMQADELQHATTAIASGGTKLPGIFKILMRYTAKIMTTVASKV